MDSFHTHSTFVDLLPSICFSYLSEWPRTNHTQVGERACVHAPDPIPRIPEKNTQKVFCSRPL